MNSDPFFCAYGYAPNSDVPYPCQHRHRTFEGAASCAVYYDADVIAKLQIVDGDNVLVETRSLNDIPEGESDQMLVVKVYNNRRMAFFRYNEGDAEWAARNEKLEAGETDFIGGQCYLRAPWAFRFGHWYTLEEAKAHNQVPYFNVDGVGGEEPGYYVDGARVE